MRHPQMLARRIAGTKAPPAVFMRPARIGDESLVEVREAERVELWDGFRHTPEEAIAFGIAEGDARVLYLHGEPAGVFGVVASPSLLGVGIPWAALSDAVARYPLPFLRASRRELAVMRERFYSLWNVVDARNTHVIRWLRWLDFTIYPAEPFGPDRRPFHRFGWEASHV